MILEGLVLKLLNKMTLNTNNFLIRLDFSQTEDMWLVVQAESIDDAIKKVKRQHPNYKHLTVYTEEVSFIK